MEKAELLNQLIVRVTQRMRKNQSRELTFKTGLHNAKAVEDSRIISILKEFSKRSDVGFIGIKDRNGRDICNGDTVCIHNITFNTEEIGEVVYEPEKARFCIEVNRTYGAIRHGFHRTNEERDGHETILSYYEYEVVHKRAPSPHNPSNK